MTTREIYTERIRRQMKNEGASAGEICTILLKLERAPLYAVALFAKDIPAKPLNNETKGGAKQ